MEINGVKIKWLGHAGFKISNSKIVYIDPFKISEVSEEEKGDFILITHEHYDHCSIEDVQKLVKQDTIVVTVADCQSKLSSVVNLIKDVKLVKPYDNLDFGEVKIKAVPAYNKDKEFHPKSNEWVGFVVEINGVKIYHTGDSDLVDEIKEVEADILLVPVGGTYTMNAEEAAELANTIKPKIAIPMHYGSIVGSKEDALKFKELVEPGIKVFFE